MSVGSITCVIAKWIKEEVNDLIQLLWREEVTKQSSNILRIKEAPQDMQMWSKFALKRQRWRIRQYKWSPSTNMLKTQRHGKLKPLPTLCAWCCNTKKLASQCQTLRFGKFQMSILKLQYKFQELRPCTTTSYQLPTFLFSIFYEFLGFFVLIFNNYQVSLKDFLM